MQKILTASALYPLQLFSCALWASLTVIRIFFLPFLFVISALLFLFWTPSAKSWLSRMQGSVVLIFFCFVFLSVFSILLGMFSSGFSSFCYCLCCWSNYIIYLILCDNTHHCILSLTVMLLTFKIPEFLSLTLLFHKKTSQSK